MKVVEPRLFRALNHPEMYIPSPFESFCHSCSVEYPEAHKTQLHILRLILILLLVFDNLAWYGSDEADVRGDSIRSGQSLVEIFQNVRIELLEMMTGRTKGIDARNFVQASIEQRVDHLEHEFLWFGNSIVLLARAYLTCTDCTTQHNKYQL